MNAPLGQFDITLFLIASIVAYGIFEYQRREQNFKMTLLALKYGKEPSVFEGKPQVWKLLTTGFVAFALFAASIGFLILRPHIKYGGQALYILSILFFLILVPLMFALARDIKDYREHNKTKGE